MTPVRPQDLTVEQLHALRSGLAQLLVPARVRQPVAAAALIERANLGPLPGANGRSHRKPATPRSNARVCHEPSCGSFGDPDFGQGTCPAEHAVRR